MVKSSLAHIADVANATLERELTAPTIPREREAAVELQSRKRVAGFVFKSDADEKSAREEAQRYAKSRIETYVADRDKLKAMLAERGITPKAMLPVNAWHRICRESGLIRLAPDSDGRVGVNTDVVRELMPSMAQAAWTIFGIWVVAVAVAGFTGFGIYGLGGAFFFSLIIGAVAGLAIGLVGVICNESGLKETMRERFARLMLGYRIRAFCKRPWPQVLSAFFPEGEGRAPASYGARATLVLPQPPESFLETLSKARNLSVKVAAEPAAIAFTERPADILNRVGQEQIDILVQERIQRERLLAEPIAYVENGTAVGIIDQFGDFVIEKQVVEKVMSTSFVP